MTDDNKTDAQGSVPGMVHVNPDGTTNGQPVGATVDTHPLKEMDVKGAPIASTPTTTTSETDNTVGGSVNVHHDAPNTADPVTNVAKGTTVNPMHPASTGATDPNKANTGS